MLTYTLKRFPHWTPAKHSGKKYIKNHLLNLKYNPPQPKSHDNIIFKNYTGNEILNSLKNVSELRPSEISGALIELNYRSGLPADYDWNTNELIQKVADYTTPRLPQYTSRVLTGLAYAFHRLQIKNPSVWQGLNKEICKYGNKIESVGLAYSWGSFIGKGQKTFYETSLGYLPNHVQGLNGRNLLLIVRGAVKEGVEVGDLFERLLYQEMLKKKKMCSPEQIQEFLELLNGRKDFDEEKKKMMEEALEYKTKMRNR